MPVYLIHVTGGAHHPDILIIQQRVYEMQIRAGFDSNFGSIGILKTTRSKRDVHRELTDGIRDADGVIVRQLGPVTIKSDPLHVHWRQVAHDLYNVPYRAGEVDIINMHQSGEI